MSQDSTSSDPLEASEDTSHASETPAEESATDEEGEAHPQKELEEQLQQAQNDLLYLRADFDNFKKQKLKERSDYLKYGSERLLVEILDVLDNFDRALAMEVSAEKPESIDSFRKGMELTAEEFRTRLKKFGAEEVACQGQAFDPNLHEALGSEETTDYPPGHIARVFRSAYKLHDRLIRPGQVIVAKAPEKSSEDQGQ